MVESRSSFNSLFLFLFMKVQTLDRIPESRSSFLETIKLIHSRDEAVRKVTLENAPGNNKMVAPDIQKDIVYFLAQEILKSIFEEISDDVFALLVDESSDVSKKEQMVFVLRYVTFGIVKERLVGLVHMKDFFISKNCYRISIC